MTKFVELGTKTIYDWCPQCGKDLTVISIKMQRA